MHVSILVSYFGVGVTFCVGFGVVFAVAFAVVGLLRREEGLFQCAADEAVTGVGKHGFRLVAVFALKFGAFLVGPLNDVVGVGVRGNVFDENLVALEQFDGRKTRIVFLVK